MQLKSNCLLYVLLNCVLSFPGTVQQHQGPPELLAQYTIQIRTAIYVIDSIQANNASSSCADSNLINDLDSTGYDGEYAEQLLYEKFLIAMFAVI